MFVVIENTPGYLPDDDDPPTFEDYADAVSYLNERAAEYADDPDGNYEVTYGCASSDNLAAVIVHDLDKTHDLGRWIAIEIDYEEEQEPLQTCGSAVYRPNGKETHYGQTTEADPFDVSADWSERA